jgi:excisionase family DNA binding protein
MSNREHEYVGPHFQEVLERARINDSFAFCCTIDEAAKILNVSSRQVRHFIQEGTLPCVDMSRRGTDYRVLRITISDLSRFIADRRRVWINGKVAKVSDLRTVLTLEKYEEILDSLEWESREWEGNYNVEELAKHV